MSNQHKLNWLAVIVLIVLIGMISYLVVVDMLRQSENGLECIYNCNNYSEMLEAMK